MTTAECEKILKTAVSPKYQEYFEYDDRFKMIRFKNFISNIFDNFKHDIFSSRFSVIAEILTEDADVVIYKFYINENGHVCCNDAFLLDSEVTVQAIRTAMTDAIEFIKQFIPKYKEYKRKLMIKQMEEI